MADEALREELGTLIIEHWTCMVSGKAGIKAAHDAKGNSDGK